MFSLHNNNTYNYLLILLVQVYSIFIITEFQLFFSISILGQNFTCTFYLHSFSYFSSDNNFPFYRYVIEFCNFIYLNQLYVKSHEM